MRVKLKLAVAVGCSLMATSASWADLTSINVSALNGVSGIHSEAQYNGSAILVKAGPTSDKDYYARSDWAGAWRADILSGPNYGSTDPFLGFCTDIANQMPGGTYNYEGHVFTDGAYGGVPPETGGNPPDPNWANSGSGQRAAWIYNTYAKPYPIAENPINTAGEYSAMALAIWEVLYEGSGTYNVASGSGSGRSFVASGNGLSTIVSGTTTVAQLANSWLNAGVAANWSGYNSTWWAERSSTGYGDVQSLIGPVSQVPEPTTWLAGALLLLPFGMSTLRKLRKS